MKTGILVVRRDEHGFYGISDYQPIKNIFKFVKQDFGQRWLTERAKKQNSLSLTRRRDSILRRRLEQMVLDGREMTSDSVVELSTMLDQKINEYMNNWRKSR